ncbi:MAG: hypothetical protein WAV67_04860 [Dokdonella sp.]
MKRLFPKAILGFFLIAGSLFGAPCWAVTNVLLNANFNDKPLNTAIGTGGPTVGEPIFVHPALEAKVQAAPLFTPSLHIRRLTGTGFNSVVFEFPGQASISEGDLRAAFTVQAPSTLTDFRFVVSEPANSLHLFGQLNFTSAGTITANDAAGSSGQLGTYSPNQILKVEYIYHIDARTYDLRVNNVLLLGNRAHGVTAAGIGIGRITFATSQTTEWVVDDVFVTHTRTLLLDADFNDKNVNFPIGTAGASKGEPTSVANGLSAIVRAAPFSTKSLHFSQASPMVNNIARFELLGGAQVRSGELHVGFTVRTPAVFDTFRARMRERNSTTGFFGGIEFNSAGQIATLNGLNGDEPFFDYDPDTTYRIELVYQVATGTYDIYVDGRVRLGRAKHSVTDPEKGFGAIDFSLTGNSAEEWAIDDLRVEQKPLLLDADFNQQSLNQQIGTGGAASGQPIFINSSLFAETLPFMFFTPSLAIQQSTTGTPKAANFEFVDNAKVTGGELRIGMRVLSINSGDSFTITMSEQGSSTGTFGTLTFLSNGDVRTFDSGGSAVFTTHAALVEQQFEFRYRFDAGLYDIYVDRVLRLANRPIPAGVNIGRITASTTTTMFGRWVVDDLYAYRVNDTIFKTGFDCDGCE